MTRPLIRSARSAHGFSFGAARRAEPGRRLTLVSALIALGAMALGVAMLAQLHAAAAASAASDARATLTLLRAEMTRNIESVDLSAQAIADNAALPEFDRLGARIQEALLFDRALRARDIGTAILFDRAGKARFASRDNVAAGRDFSDRDYFRRFLGRAEDGAYLGGPLLSRVSGSWFVPLSRRVTDAAGGFAGVVMAPIYISYFDKLLHAASGDHADRIWLVTGDGQIVSQSPQDAAATGAAFDAWSRIKPLATAGDPGAIVAAPHGEGHALVAKVGDWPLYLVLRPNPALTSHRWARSLALGAALAALAALAVILAGMLRREGARRRSALTRIAALNAELERLSRTDSLTGLGNRRCFNETLARELEKAARYRRALAVALIDVDRFDRYNERYGHAGGDACLARLARTLRENVRDSADLICRFGGETFALILPETDEAGARTLCERLRAKVAALNLAHRDAPGGHVTISAGLAALPPGQRGDAAALLRAADAALSRGKATGRDRAGAANDAGEGADASAQRCG